MSINNDDFVSVPILKKLTERFISERYADFKYKPQSVKSRKYGVIIKFPDINPLISFSASNSSIGWNVTFCGEGWDESTINYVDGITKTDDGKYGCTYCLDEKKMQPVDSLYDLYVDHFFSRLLEYTNQFSENTKIALQGCDGGTIMLEVREKEDDPELFIPWIEPSRIDRPNILFAFPAIVRNLDKKEKRLFNKLKRNSPLCCKRKSSHQYCKKNQIKKLV